MRRRRILPLIYSTHRKLSNRDPLDESDRLARVFLSNILPPPDVDARDEKVCSRVPRSASLKSF